jgi:hypothetical protein
MIYRDIYEKAASIIGRESIEDYRPAVYEVPAPMDNAITIWLKNGDVIIYKAMEGK